MYKRGLLRVDVNMWKTPYTRQGYQSDHFVLSCNLNRNQFIASLFYTGQILHQTKQNMAKKVTFTLSAEVAGEATSGLLLGEFNNWNYNDGISLKKQKDGSMKATAELEAGKRYEYRYLLNDGRWVNDHSADHYVHISGLQVDNCVINVPEETKAVKKAPVKTVKEVVAEPVPAKVKAPAKKVATVKEKASVAKTPKTKVAKPKAGDTGK